MSAEIAEVQAILDAHGFDPGPQDGVWGRRTRQALVAAVTAARAAPGPVSGPARAGSRTLAPADYAEAAGRLDGDVAKIHAVKAVESGGGWFTDIRREILDLDGPGGFLDGPDLPKILFEAHLFARETGGRYNASHPNISAPRWNRKLYVGGQGEYARLHAAMRLDEEAALKSASWGMFQILGANHKAAGYPDVRAYVDAMKAGERAHLLAFVEFIRNTPGLLAKYRQIGPTPAACAPFCRAYNGLGYASHNYHGRTASEYRKAKAAH